MKYTTDKLNRKEIINGLHSFFSHIEIVDEIVSTNTVLKKQASILKEGSVLISDKQLEGRGRNARTFYSPAEKGIYMSFLVKPPILIEESLKITACAGVAVYEAIKKVYGIESKIKWVNDIYIEDKKVAGILCESGISANKDTIDYCVVGIGINVHQQVFADSIKDIAASVEDYSDVIHSRNILIKEVLNCFYYHYTKLDQCEYLSIYKENSYVLNKKIIVSQDNASYQAEAIDILENGSLQVKKEDGEVVNLTSGELHIHLT